ncbi:aldo/keto reductase [Pyrofollis japonicus]|nr:aldo/keto reductase [Pyrofollis japonicus]
MLAETCLGKRCELRVSGIGIGFWQAGGRLWGRYGLREAVEVIGAALEHGIVLFDTAEIYGNGRSEKLLGEALRKLRSLGEAVIVTKVAGFRVTWNGFRKAVEGSVRRLGRRPDIVLYHWPPPWPFTVCRVVKLLEKLVEHGLTSYIGVSNFNAADLEEAAHCAKRHEILVDQVHYSLAHRVPEKRLIPLAQRLGVRIMAWGPLAKGALAGKTKPDNAARMLDPVFLRAARDKRLQEALETIERKHGVSKAVIALAWLIAKKAIPVVGARRRKHVEDAARAATLKLREEDVRVLDKASSRYLGRADYSELRFNRAIPPPLQWFTYKLLLRGI